MKFDKDYGLKILAEFFATVMMMCLLACSWVNIFPYNSDLLQTGFGVGFAIGSGTQCFGMISGAHMNPCVSIALCITGQLKPVDMGLYILVQILGAFIGYAIVLGMMPWAVFSSGPGVTIPHPMISDAKAFGIEFVLTSTVVLCYCSTFDPRNAAKMETVSMRMASLYSMTAFLAGYYTGASVNPVRTLAPAVMQNTYTKIWIYFVSQFPAAILMGLLWRFVFSSDRGGAKADD